jgi:thiol-disulfide isomerase/thioredoxin
MDRFWMELPAREKSAVLRGADVWCVPVPALRQTLGQLAEAGADAPRREARNIVLNYARRLEHVDASARRYVAAGLNELTSIIESLWPNHVPEDLSRGAMKALDMEMVPETAALLAAVVESLGRIAVTAIIADSSDPFTNLENALRTKSTTTWPRWRTAWLRRNWLCWWSGAGETGPDPVLPRLLQRDAERLLDRLTLLLTDPRGAELVQPMARLLRAIGVPVLNLLEARLYEARRQRVTAAIKLLAAADPERLLRGLARAMASWEWNLQDLAVSELSRPANSASIRSTAFVFSAILADAHPLVVPMMLQSAAPGGKVRATPNAVGTARLDLTLKDMHGADVRLADYKGKVIVLNFWATWCGPCQSEIPELVKAYDVHPRTDCSACHR